MEKLEGQPGEFKATFATPSGSQTIEVGAVVLATGWVPLDQKFLAPMGLGQSTKVVDAATFGKMLVADQVNARRIAFVLDTTIAEEAVRKAAEEAEAAPEAAEAAKPAEGEEEKGFVKANLESFRHVAYSNAVNSVGMLRLANTVCEKTNDTCQTFILYKDMTVPGILERFYKKMQDRLGVMMTKADVTDIREAGDHMVVSCKNTLLGMDFDLDVDLVVLPTGLVPTTAKDVTVCFDYRQGPDFPDLNLFDGFADSNYICFPYETRRTGVYAAGCVRQPLTMCSRPCSALRPPATVLPCIPARATFPTPCSTLCVAPSASAARKNAPSALWTTTKRERPSPIRHVAAAAAPALALARNALSPSPTTISTRLAP